MYNNFLYSSLFLEKLKQSVILKINLSSEHKEAIDDLKLMFKNVHSLRLPDFKCPKGFSICSDASEIGVGASIFQTKDGMPIAYASKTLGAAGKNYENLHREARALIFALEKFSKYILNSPIVTKVYTDSKVLSFLKSAKSPKLKRWFAYIQSFNIEIIHKAGNSDTLRVPDALSRLVKFDNSHDDHLMKSIQEEIVIGKITTKNPEIPTSKILSIKSAHDTSDHCTGCIC